MESSTELAKPPLAASDAEKRILAVLDQIDRGERFANVSLTDGRFLRQMTEAVGAQRGEDPVARDEADPRAAAGGGEAEDVDRLQLGEARDVGAPAGIQVDPPDLHEPDVALVVGGQVVAAMRRVAGKKRFLITVFAGISLPEIKEQFLSPVPVV